jgi:chromosome partitioning protein
VKISEASSHGKPVVIYDMKSMGAISYIELAREFLSRELAR